MDPDVVARDRSRLARSLRRVPALADAELSIAPLPGGITNRNYLVAAARSAERYVARIPGADTHLLGIDRAAEAGATRAAAAIGIGPEVVASFPDEGLLVTRFIPGRQLGPDDFDDPGAVWRVARALRALHAGPPIAGAFEPVSAGSAYLAEARRRGLAVRARQRDAERLARRIRTMLGPGRVVPAPCHNDLLAANIIDDGVVVRIVDWEYAAMGDPRFDLGNLAANNELTADQVAALVEAHDGEPPDARRLAEVLLMRVLSDFREAAWGAIQQVISGLDADFVAYADRHFDRMLATAQSPAFREATGLIGSA